MKTWFSKQSSIDFNFNFFGGILISKFDGPEKERKEKDELINSLQINVSSLKVEVKNLEKKQMIRSNTRVEAAS